MNKNYIIDSSVFSKLLVYEEDSALAENLFAYIIENKQYIIVPSIFVYELIGVFRKHLLSKKIINDFLKEYVENKSYIKIINLDSRLINSALDIAEKGHNKSGFPTFYDSVYHALAISQNCNFITADKRHFEKTKKLGNVRLLDEACKETYEY